MLNDTYTTYTGSFGTEKWGVCSSEETDKYPYPSSIIIIIVWLEREFLCQQEWHVSTIVNRVGIYSSHSRWTTNQFNETDLHIILGRITNY